MKVYIDEPWSSDVTAKMEAESAPATTQLTRVEVPAAFARSSRVGSVSSSLLGQLVEQFQLDWNTFIGLAVSDEVLALAALLSVRRGLRAYDAVHLASAVLWRDVLGSSVTLVTFDRQLWRAARDEDLYAWPEGFGD